MVDKYSPGRYDPLTGNYFPADLSATNAEAAAAANKTTADAFIVKKSGLNVVMNGKYQFSFAYLFADPNNASNLITGTRSPNFVVTLQTPDLTQAVTNLVVTPGLLSYGVKWDLIDKALAANKWLIDIQIYESLTGAFAGEEYLVWDGNGSSATILVSNTNNRWIRVDTRDQDYRKKSVTYGPFKATDPIVVDTTGPANVTSVTAQSGIDTSGYLGFNAYANISWPAVTGGGIRGYRIRFSNDSGATYSYVDSPGTGTTYKLAGLVIGSTYKIAVATYDEYNNTSSLYTSGPDVTVTGTPSVTNFIKGGDFEFGVGVGSVATNKGLYFDASNYWYINAANSARLKVGGSTSNYLLWDGSTFAVDGNITARGGQFSGNIFMSTSGASIYNGTIDSATGNLTGNGFALNSTGLKVASGTNSVTIAAATGTITANAGSIAGWNLSGTTLSKNNVILDSTGQIQVGSSASASVYLNSSNPSFVMWAGNNTPDANAKFRVGTDGTLYAQNAVLGSGSSIAGYATTGSLANYALTSALAAYATTQALTAVSNTANNALPATNFSKLEVLKKLNNSTNGATLNGGILEAGTVVADSIVSTYVYAGYIDAEKIRVGTLNGQRLTAGLDDYSTGFIDTGASKSVSGYGTVKYVKIKALGLESTSNSGFVSSVYPWIDNSASLGTNGFSWNNIYIGSNAYFANSTTYKIGTTGDAYLNGYGISGGYGVTSDWSPRSDSTNSLGLSTRRWRDVWSVDTSINSSDIRLKKDIINSALGLNFINALRPVSYKWKNTSFKEVLEDKEIEHLDKNGNVDLIEIEKVPKIIGTDENGRDIVETTSREGSRDHYGFIAQEVREALEESGVGDKFAGWVLDDHNNPDSRQNLRYSEFISPLVKAVQELSDMVKSLQTEVNTLKGI